MTKEGLQKPNYWGSVTQASSFRLGNVDGEEVYAPLKGLLPMVDPNDLVLGGWDISHYDMARAMERAQVIDFALQQQLAPLMKDIQPLPGHWIISRFWSLCSGMFLQESMIPNL